MYELFSCLLYSSFCVFIFSVLYYFVYFVRHVLLLLWLFVTGGCRYYYVHLSCFACLCSYMYIFIYLCIYILCVYFYISTLMVKCLWYLKRVPLCHSSLLIPFIAIRSERRTTGATPESKVNQLQFNTFFIQWTLKGTATYLCDWETIYYLKAWIGHSDGQNSDFGVDL